MGAHFLSNDSISDEYMKYLSDHRNFVQKAFEWFEDNLEEVFEYNGKNFHTEILSNILSHDASKYRDAEFFPYAEYFYGSGDNQEEFDKAWLIHIHKNPHHWQYWLLHEDEGSVKILDMDYPYIVEMICDWWGFSFKGGNLNEIFSWYEEHKKIMRLSSLTRKIVEDILALMEDKINE